MNKQYLGKKDIQAKLLNILKFVDEIARENSINYSLGGGTLLGAVRHQGFIPWDNDVDIMLIRSEYERLISVLKEETKGSNFKLIVNDFEKGSQNYNPLFHARLVAKDVALKSINLADYTSGGLGVEIFPIDLLPKSNSDNFRQVVKDKMNSALSADIRYYWTSNSRIKSFSKIFLYFPKFLKSIRNGNMSSQLITTNNFMKSVNWNDAKEASWLGTFYDEAYSKELFENYSDYQFEDTVLMGIRDANQYLENLYGDYMVLPPEEKRTAHEFVKFYYKNKKG
ncbi:LicD family protein [Leuconostoc lactis]|uniref:LicD family protein n=1 Tax=Leuconostoc lactis TaxID=1246 RepID=UPI002729C288|nr:LicD family protein [Leuconostoc lactis]WKY78773.1 LicD family protein [Leuconostoc lactis]